MSEIHNTAKALNPWILHYQKLGLELKCALCLNLLNKPTLLPCNHVFCKFCIPELGSECPTCKNLFVGRELREAPFLENIITNYKSMDAALNSTNIWHLSTGDPRKSPNQCRESVTITDNKNRKKVVEVELEGSDAGSKDGMRSSETRRAKRLFKDVLDTASNEIVDRTFLEEPLHTPNGDRQKKQNYGSPESAGEGLASPSDKIADSNLNGEIHDAPNTNQASCAFCHSSEQTELTGPLVYYAMEKEVKPDIAKEVEPDIAAQSKATPVHLKCLEWSPKVFYKDDKVVINLQSELERASKLKCSRSRCGLMGAALGCYVKSCPKSYHVTCAVEIPDCRWDCENYLMLCPTHNYAKFPRKKSKTQNLGSEKKDSSSSKRPSQVLKFWESSPNGPKKWVFCGSALSSEEKDLMDKFATMCGATVSSNWNSKVTHVIAATNADGKCSRTYTFLMAILSGQWILTMDWIKVSMKANRPMNEEAHEVKLDNLGCRDGPKTGRLMASTNAPKLFEGLKFHFSGQFDLADKNELIQLVEVGGGTVIDSVVEMFAQRQENRTNCKYFFVYHFGTASSPYTERLAKAHKVDKGHDSQSLVIPHTWILESIAACRLKAF